MVEIRPAVPADATELARLQVSSLRSGAVEYYDEDQLDVLAPPDFGADDIIDAILESENRYAPVAERDSEIVGFAVFHADGGELAAIFVDPAVAGEGIGRQLLEYVEAYARGENVERIEVVAALNAVGFYESCGFDRIEEVVSIEDRDVEIPAVEMEKTL